MNKLNKVLLFLLVSFTGMAQYNMVLNFQNNIRSYYDLEDYTISQSLTLEAQSWADYIASEDSLIISTDMYGETLHRTQIIPGYTAADYYLDAAVGWVVECNDPGYYQTTCIDCTQVGYGMAENNNFIYVVAKYDKLYE